MSGGGPKYEPLEDAPPDPASLLLDGRIDRIDEVVAQRTRGLTVVLDRLQDCFNMAAIVRTCEGFGIQDLYVIEHPELRFKPNGSVTQGCDKWIDIHRFRSFEPARAALKARGFRILASTLEEGRGSRESLFRLEFREPTALVFGNERHGVSEEVLSQVDGTFWIPMRGFTQSFNVSVAAAISVSRAVAWREERLGVVGDLDGPSSEEVRQKFRVLSVKQRKKIYR